MITLSVRQEKVKLKALTTAITLNNFHAKVLHKNDSLSRPLKGILRMGVDRLGRGVEESLGRSCETVVRGGGAGWRQWSCSWSGRSGR